MSLLLCILAFLIVTYISRKSLVGGLTATLAVGYFYGILRANLAEAMAHFIFDGAVIGFYLGWMLNARRAKTAVNTRLVRPWLIALMGWPVFLALLPIQSPVVQLVGLRGSMFLLPIILLGSHMSDDDRQRLAWPIAGLNSVALVFAALEFFIGLESFYPYSEVTELIYRSRVNDTQSSYRIPATFVNSHAYAGTMVCTIPLLMSRWTGPAIDGLRRFFLVLGIVAAIVGVFISAARTHAIVLFVLIVVATMSLRMRASRLIVWIMILCLTGAVVWQDARLQRFTTLADTEYLTSRLEGSVNATFFTLIVDYPMGNGIGGGGTSLPYFLAKQVANPIGIENEYGRILLELGLPGLLLWVAFAVWVLGRGLQLARGKLDVGRRLALAAVAAYLLTASTGTGMLTSIPQSAFVMLLIGWVVGSETARDSSEEPLQVRAQAHRQPLVPVNRSRA